MTDDDEDSDFRHIDERGEPPSPKRQRTSAENTAPDPNITSELVNYLPLMSNSTLNTIQNNLHNISRMPRITIKPFARISDSSNPNKIKDSALYALLAENNNNTSLTADHNHELCTRNLMDNELETLRAEADQNNHPRVDVYEAEASFTISSAYGATMTIPRHEEPVANPNNHSRLHASEANVSTSNAHGADNLPMHNEALRSVANPNNNPRLHVQEASFYTHATTNDYPRAPGFYPQDQRVPKIPPTAFEVNGATMPHMPSANINANRQPCVVPNSGSLETMAYSPPPAQKQYAFNTNLPAAMTNGWPVQNDQTQMYMDIYNKQYRNPGSADIGRARTNYNQEIQHMNHCGYPRYGNPCNMSVIHPSSPHPRDPIPPSLYSMGMVSNGQKLASPYPYLQTVPNTDLLIPGNGYGQAYGTNYIPQAVLAKMHKQAHLQCIQSVRTETTSVVSASGYVNQKPEVKPTNKRTYIKKICTARKQAVKPDKNTSKAIDTMHVKHAHAPSNMEIQATGNNIGLSINLTSANMQPNMNNIHNFMQPPLNTEAQVTRNNIGMTSTNLTSANMQPNMNNIHSVMQPPLNTEAQATRNNIRIPSTNITSANRQTDMNNIHNLIQPPLNTEAHLMPTTMRTNTSDNIKTVSHYIDLTDEIQAPNSKEGNLQPVAMKNNNDRAQTELIEAQTTRNNIGITSINLTSANMQPNMNNIYSVMQPPLNTEAQSTRNNIEPMTNLTSANMQPNMNNIHSVMQPPLNTEAQATRDNIEPMTNLTSANMQSNMNKNHNFMQPPLNTEEQASRNNIGITSTNLTSANMQPNMNNINSVMQPPLNTEAQATRNNIRIPSTNITSANRQPDMNNIRNLIRPPLNTEADLMPTTMRTNSSDNIKTISHYIDLSDEIQAPKSKGGNIQPVAMKNNNDRAQTELIEAQALISRNINGERSVNTELATINMNRAHAPIPLIMDEADMSINTNNPHVATSLYLTDTTTTNLKNGTFSQPPNNDTNGQNALTSLNKKNDIAQTGAITSNTLVTVSATCSTTNKLSRDIENEVRRCRVNSKTDSTQDGERANFILNTSGYRTETIVTTVELRNYVSNVTTQYLQDILNNAQRNAAAIDDHVSKCDDTDDHNEASIDHEQQEMIASKQDNQLETARKKLAWWRSIEHKEEDSLYEYDYIEYIEEVARRYIENSCQIKKATDPNREYTAQVTVSCDRPCPAENVQDDCSTTNTEQTSTSNNVSISQRRQELLEINKFIKNNQKINKASESRENNERHDEARGKDPKLFFKFQIKFFASEMDRLKETHRESAEEVKNDLHDLKARRQGRKDQGATAEMKYKCHACCNIAIYSPRSLYYSDVENSRDEIQKCPFCIAFRKNYNQKFRKYIQTKGRKKKAYLETKLNASQRDDARINSTDVRQSHSTNSFDNQRDSRAGKPPSAKKAKIENQAKHNMTHVLDVNKQTTQDETNDFVVKLPLNRIKDSTVKALMQYKSGISNKSDRKEGYLNIAKGDNSDKSSANSENREVRSISTETTTCSTLAEQRNRNVTHSTSNSVTESGVVMGKIMNAGMYRNSNNDDKNRTKIKHIGTETATGANPAEQNGNSNPASDNNQDNNKSQNSTTSANEELNVNTIALNNKDNANDIARNCELRESINTETSRTNQTNTSSDGINTEANNKSESAKLPQTTADIAQKDGKEKRENNEKIHNDITRNDGRPPGENHDESGDKVEKSLNDCRNTLKKNCNSNEEELPQVKNSEKKQNKKSHESKNQTFAGIKFVYLCKCSILLSKATCFLNHLDKDHNIQKSSVPPEYARIECPYCLHITKNYSQHNAHIKAQHLDKYTQLENMRK